MKFLILIITLNIIFITNVSSEQNKSCKELVDKPIEWSKCVKNKSIELGKKGIELGKEGSKKLNTDSKLTDWLKNRIKNQNE